MGFTSDNNRWLRSTLFLLTVTLAGFVSAQASVAGIVVEKSSNLGTIRGIVRDEGGGPIAEASVAIFKAGTSRLLKQVESARDGSFVAKVIPGSYTILAVANGFNPVTLYGVDVSRAADLNFGFKLERAGSGNTLPEKRLDRNSSKWRVRAAQMQRSIYQNREGEAPVSPDAAETAAVDVEPSGSSNRQTQTVVETFASSNAGVEHAGANFATALPLGETASVLIAGQAGIGKNAPQRLEFRVKPAAIGSHQLRFNTSIGRIGIIGPEDKQLAQFSFQALDEWKVREGIVLVFGFDYARFVGAGDDFAIAPRLGFQYDLDSKTRVRTSFTTQTEERSWAQALDLEGESFAFPEPVAVPDVFLSRGKPQIAVSRRIEFGVERILSSRSNVEANFFFDTTTNRGVGLNSSSFGALGDGVFQEFVGDQSGSARGIRVVYTRRVSGPLSASAGYSFGNGQRLSGRAITDPLNIFESSFFNSFFAQLAADLKTGTSLKTVYRLSPQATVFALDPFKGNLAIYDPGLSVLVTQDLPTLGLPFHAQAVVDARNLFDFQTAASSDEGVLRLTSAGRTLRGGIRVRF
jgi:hypothetical protein